MTTAQILLVVAATAGGVVATLSAYGLAAWLDARRDRKGGPR